MATSSEMSRFRNQLDKRYGDRLTNLVERPVQYEVISTGSLTLDIAMRTGGLIRGRTHEFIGMPGAAKTTLGILAAAEHQKATKKAIGWIDMEQSFDFDWARAHGLDTSSKGLLHIYPDSAEDVSDMSKMMSQTDLFSMIVVDSIGGMESEKAFTKDAGDTVMGKNAQVITRMVKFAAAMARQHNITVVYINQLRANLSGMGVSDIAAGPRALGYNTTFSIKMARKGGAASDVTRKVKIGGEEDQVGQLFTARVQRSRVSPAGRIAEFWLNNQDSNQFGPVGIDQVDEAVTLGVRMGVIKQSGGWYTLPGEDKALNGTKKVAEALRCYPDLVGRIRTEAMKLTAHEVTPETETVEEEPADD